MAILAIFIPIYQINKNDEQINKQIRANEENSTKISLFEKKQKAILTLYNVLNNYNVILDSEYIFIPDKKIYSEYLEEIENLITDIINFIFDKKNSPDFKYYPKEIQLLIDKFLNYSNQHFDAEYFEIHGIPFKDNEEYMELLNILKEIYDKLKNEIGKNV
ncbi:hypothetical protein [uncultured Methanobrevibacter sp.]|uniref:hypothetical protein n=1 Tax=uncultured Methanobrevibacter sp. TaxID=253161 RepID=UPI00260D1904|nr:hypothetical protein [uncultured Methanobrevibacter sp.]